MVKLRPLAVRLIDLSLQLGQKMDVWGTGGGHAVSPWANVAEGREMQSVFCPP